MAFPQVQDADTTSGTVTANTQVWTLTYPANIVSGNLLMVFLAHDGGSAIGWSPFTGLGSFTEGTVVLGVAYKFADGTESGTFTLDMGASEQGAWRVLRITGAHASTPPETANFGSSGTTPDPPNLNPTNWDVEDTLWFAAVAADHGNTNTTAWPLPDDNFDLASGGATGADLGMCRDELAQASLDPGTFTIDQSEGWITATVAVRPAAAVATEFHHARRLRQARMERF